MFGGQAIFCACLGLLFRLPRRVPFASVQKEPKDSPRHPAPAASRLGCPRCIVAPGGTPPRSFVDRGGSRGILPLVPLRNDSARPPDGAGLPPHHLEGKPHFVDARNPIRRADTAYGGIRPTGLHGNERRKLAVLLFLEFLSCLYGSEPGLIVRVTVRLFLSYLYGSEPDVRPTKLQADFLSCLYGSELNEALASLPGTFLSCLYGSEPAAHIPPPHVRFLSCLYGSELVPVAPVLPGAFLSCLYGSEQFEQRIQLPAPFLSCLYGSELQALEKHKEEGFLSCLYGSELAPKTYNHLKEKEIPSFSRQKPSFFEVS